MIESIVAGLVSGLIIAFLFKYVFIPKVDRVFNNNQKGSIKSTFRILQMQYFNHIFDVMKELVENNFDTSKVNTITIFSAQPSNRDEYVQFLDDNSVYLDHDLRIILHNTTFFSMAFLKSVNSKQKFSWTELRIIKADIFKIFQNRNVHLEEESRDILENYVVQYNNLAKQWYLLHSDDD